MRLIEKGKVGDGNPQSDIFRKFMGKHQIGRGTGSSTNAVKETNSLDYKSPNSVPSSSLTHPPAVKPTKRQPQDQILAEQQQKQQRPARQVKTRARGASGLPPRKLSLNELAHLDHDQFLKALKDDPDLARSFAEEHAKSEQSKTGGPKMKRSMKRDAKYRRTFDGTVEKQSEFLEELKKGGVPVVQWTVLIVIFVVIIYNFYKILAGPQASANKKVTRTPNKRKQQKQTKTKKQASAGSTEEAVEEEADESEKILADPLANGKKKKLPSKRLPKKPNNAVKQKSTTANSSTVTNSTNGKEKQETKPGTNNGASLPTVSVSPPTWIGDVDTSEATGEWQTVRKRSEPVSKLAEPEAAPKSEPDNVAKKEAVIDKPVPKAEKATAPLEPPPTIVEPLPAAAPDAPEKQLKPELPNDEDIKEKVQADEEPDIKNKKNKKKAKKRVEEPESNKEKEFADDVVEEKKEAPTATEKTEKAVAAEPKKDPPKKEDPEVVHMTPTATKNDAELALQLQAEEEVYAKKAAEAAAAKLQEDVWEEVTSRRRRPNKVVHEEAAIAT